MKTDVIESLESKASGRHRFRLVSTPSGEVAELDALDALNPARRYLDSLAAPSRRSMRANLGRVARLLRVPFSAVPWARLRASHIETLRARLTDARLAPATVNATLAALRGVARHAFLLRALPPDEYQLICQVRRVRGTRERAGRALDAGEVAALLDACARDKAPSGRRDACLIALLAGGGLRRAEAVSLDLSDYRERAGILLVHGKGDKERLVYFSDGGARRCIREWLDARGSLAGPLLLPIDRQGRLQWRRLTGQAVYNALRKRARHAGVRRKFSPHSLRRFFASELLEQGAGMGEVKELLGHASIETTVIYDRRGEKAKRNAAKLVCLPYKAGGGGGRGRKRRRRRRRKGK